MKVPSSKKNHFFLVSAMVTFTIEGEEGNIRSHMLNTMIKSQENTVNLERLGRAQQAVQLRLAQILGEDAPKSNVIDVVIIAISPMGYMSDKEFDSRQEVTPTNTGVPESLQ